MASARSKNGSLAWLLAGVPMIFALLYFFPPEHYRLYPRCLFYSMTGLQCPGCGGLRAAHKLLHGHLAAAFQLNPLLILLSPVALLLLAAHAVKRITGRDYIRRLRHPFWLWLLLVVALAFAVARNLPFSPFNHFAG